MVKDKPSLGEKSSPVKDSFSPPRGKVLRNRARQILGPYSADWLADKTDTTRNTAKSWKAGHCLPNFENSADLARAIPEWWAMVCELSGRAASMQRTDKDFYAPEIEALQAQINDLARRQR